MRNPLSILSLLLCLVLAAGAHARALDRDTIARWINALGDLQTWSETMDDAPDLHDDELLDEAGMPDMAQMERAYREMIESHREAEAIVSRHGFRDAGQWANISTRIVQSVIAIEMEGQRPEMDAQMAEAMRQLENMPPEQRAMIEQQMRHAMGAMDSMTADVREEDLPAVRAMREELRAVMDFGDDDAW